MSWFSALTREQRQRQEALREARRIAYDSNKTASSEEILAIAEFILKGPTDNEQRRPGRPPV